MSIGPLPPLRAGTRSARWRMKLSRAVQEFVTEGRTYLSPATLAAYESDLGRVAALASPDSVLAFTPDLIRAYFLGLSHQNRRMATLYRKHSALNEFGRWGEPHGPDPASAEAAASAAAVLRGGDAAIDGARAGTR